jgi:hypothetical protein
LNSNSGGHGDWHQRQMDSLKSRLETTKTQLEANNLQNLTG